MSNQQLSEKLQNMLALVDKVTSPLDQNDQDNISQHIGKTIVTMDNDIIQELSSQEHRTTFRRHAFAIYYVQVKLGQTNCENMPEAQNTRRRRNLQMVQSKAGTG